MTDAREQTEISGSNTRDTVLEWGEGSELQSIERHFKENGVSKNPEDFTYAAIFKSRIIARASSAKISSSRREVTESPDRAREKNKF